MGLTRCYKTEVFYIYICSFSAIFYAISISDTCLRNRKSISTPNFDKVSQFTADMNYGTSGLGKRTAAILDLYFRFLFWRMCSHRRVILHLPSKFRRDRKIGGGVMTSYRFFKMAAYSRKCTPGFRFSDGICLGRWKSICQPNFDRYLNSRLR